MAQLFPLSLDDFFAGLSVTSLSFELGENIEGGDQTGKGEILTHVVGPRLWAGAIHVAADSPRKLERVKTKMDLLRSAGSSFYIGHPDFKYPEADPDGTLLGVSNVSIAGIAANNRELNLRDAPAGYTVSAGDHIEIQHSGTRSYYRVVTGGVFSGAPSTTPLIEVQPFIHDLAQSGSSVKLVRPVLKAVYVPGSYKPGSRIPGIAQGFTFRWRQTYL